VVSEGPVYVQQIAVCESVLSLSVATWFLSVHIETFIPCCDRLFGLALRVPGYRSRGLGFDYRRYQIFGEIVGLERGPFRFVRITEELLE
jgi:hypothetical protein